MTIQAAINAAKASYTILVETGKGYNESDTVGFQSSRPDHQGRHVAGPVLDGRDG